MHFGQIIDFLCCWTFNDNTRKNKSVRFAARDCKYCLFLNIPVIY
jgi:hypothetical protein